MAKRVSTPPPTSTLRKPRTKPVSAATARLPTHDEIAQRAFDLYVARGQADGTAVNDWLRAESELAASTAISP
jgi:hypothetical protein